LNQLLILMLLEILPEKELYISAFAWRLRQVDVVVMARFVLPIPTGDWLLEQVPGRPMIVMND
jgi:hypothetical protein